MKKIAVLMALYAAFMTGCSGDDSMDYNEKVTVEPVTVTGSVSGVVYSAVDGLPLADVNVTVTVGGTRLSVATDENGFFTVSGVPAYGEASVSYLKDGFLPAYGQGSFPSSDGNVPHDGLSLTLRPVWMIATGSRFTVHVMDMQGNPVSGMTVMGEVKISYLSQYSDGSIVSFGEHTYSATTDGSGIAVFTDLPIFPQMKDDRYKYLYINFPQMDTDGDGIPDLKGQRDSVDLRTESYIDVYLPPYNAQEGNITVSRSSIFHLRHSMFSCGAPTLTVPGEEQFVEFGRSVDRVSVEIYDDSGAVVWPEEDIPVTLTAGNTRAVFTAPSDMESGKIYWLKLMVSAVGAASYVKSVPVFTPPADGQDFAIKAVYPDDPAASDPVYIVEFNYPVGAGCRDVTQIPGGSNGIVFINWDLDSSGNIGDGASEIGYDHSNITLRADTDTPSLPGSIGYVGYSTKWYFSNPLGSGGSIPLNTAIFIKFHSVSSSRYLMSTPWGDSPDVLMSPLQGTAPSN